MIIWKYNESSDDVIWWHGYYNNTLYFHIEMNYSEGNYFTLIDVSKNKVLEIINENDGILMYNDICTKLKELAIFHVRKIIIYKIIALEHN